MNGVCAALGVSAIVGGVVFAAAGVQSLGSSLSPFPVPARDNALVTDGVYATGACVAGAPSAAQRTRLRNRRNALRAQCVTRCTQVCC